MKLEGEPCVKDLICSDSFKELKTVWRPLLSEDVVTDEDNNLRDKACQFLKIQEIGDPTLEIPSNFVPSINVMLVNFSK